MAENSVLTWKKRTAPTSNPPAGLLYTWSDETTGALMQKDENGVVKEYLFTAGNENKFGTELVTSEDITLKSTSSTIYQDALVISLSGLTVGKKYRVNFDFEFYTSNNSSSVWFRIYDGSTTFREVRLNPFAINRADLYQMLCYFTASDTTKMLRFQYRSNDAWATAYIQRVLGEIWRVN